MSELSALKSEIRKLREEIALLRAAQPSGYPVYMPYPVYVPRPYVPQFYPPYGGGYQVGGGGGYQGATLYNGGNASMNVGDLNAASQLGYANGG